jgi:prevent-host-death family protein
MATFYQARMAAAPLDASASIGGFGTALLGTGWPGPRTATILYMSRTVGVAELRQNLSKYLSRVERGERLIVTDRNRPVAELGPPPTVGAELDRLILEGRVSRPPRRGRPEPLRLAGAPHALSRALEDVRGER